MRHVARGRAPEYLAVPAAVVSRERSEGERHYRDNAPGSPGYAAFGFGAYRAPEVAAALAKLFDDKCAYCETSIGAAGSAQVEHYRPKGGVDGEPDHPGYWWLASTWSNLLPSCPACNQARRFEVLTEMVSSAEFARMLHRRSRRAVGKMNQFPIEGRRAVSDTCDLIAEKALLIDPTIDDPAQHLAWRLDGEQSMVEARVLPTGPSARGMSSIAVYGLNRVGLIKARTQLLTELRFQRERILDDLSQDLADPSRSRSALDRARRRAEELRRYVASDREYSSMASAFVDDFQVLLLRGPRI